MSLLGQVLQKLFERVKTITGRSTVTVTVPVRWTGYTKPPMKLTVTRTISSPDGLFGRLTVDSDPFTCVTEENKGKAIPVGIYPVEFTYSPKFNRTMPLIVVPDRDGIRLHWANWARQLEGCIAVGTVKDGDAIDDSVVTFNRLYRLMDEQAGITLEIKEDYA